MLVTDSRRTRQHAMRFGFRDVPREGEEIVLDETEAFRLHGPEGEVDREVRLASPLKGKLRLRPKARGLNVKGHIETAASMRCVRCLKEFVLPLVSDFEAFFLPIQYAPREEEKELVPEELKISFVREDELCIEDVVEEQIWLAIPLKPLCDTTCKGLCDVCGADLNYGDCGCDQNSMNPRFAVLQNVRHHLPSGRK